MTYRGKMQNGVVVLDGAKAPPDGTAVSVRALKTPAKGRSSRGKAGRGKPPTLLDTLRPFIGMGKGLPADFSVNHDHYLYGTPKEE